MQLTYLREVFCYSTCEVVATDWWNIYMDFFQQKLQWETQYIDNLLILATDCKVYY